MKSLLLLLFIPFSNAPISYRQLTWSDFKGKPTNDHVASSCTGIVIEKDTAYAIFGPDKSWTRTSDGATLRHEQLHFTITEKWVREIMKHRQQGNSPSYEGWCIQQWELQEKEYDFETDHGTNETKQKEWEEKIKL